VTAPCQVSVGAELAAAAANGKVPNSNRKTKTLEIKLKSPF
jgi:hypothetical protein